MLTKQLWREQEYYQTVPVVKPIRIDDYIYYRRMDNIADSLTLYRFPVDELAEWHNLASANHDDEQQKSKYDKANPVQVNSLMGEIPPYPYDPELNDNLNFRQSEEAKERFEIEFPE